MWKDNTDRVREAELRILRTLSVVTFGIMQRD